MSSFPAALAVGIAGIVCDRRKVLAIITTLVAGGLIVAWACMMAIQIARF